MSTYSLRSREIGKVAVANPANVVSNETDTENENRTYSDVVAARTRSPNPDPRNMVVDDRATRRRGSDRINPEISSESALSAVMPMTTSVQEDQDDNPIPWQTVKHKSCCHASLESLSKLRTACKKVNFLTSRSPVVTAEQDTAIKAAESRLTSPEKERIHKRSLRVSLESVDTSESEKSDSALSTVSPVVPTSEGSLKGKGVDPHNWGNAGIEPDELDLEAQQRQFHLWKKLQEDNSQVLRSSSNTSSNGSISNSSVAKADPRRTGTVAHQNEKSLSKGGKDPVVTTKSSNKKKARMESRGASMKRSRRHVESEEARSATRSKLMPVRPHDSPLMRGFPKLLRRWLSDAQSR
ncbi:hypothetical protein B0H10DRAFT_1939885 [Mycena sp. CBHHK59/15]|nr:hypothetical protein B0H10DRAFT_1939885 [Mycena sp. CBHHK59/15]